MYDRHMIGTISQYNSIVILYPTIDKYKNHPQISNHNRIDYKEATPAKTRIGISTKACEDSKHNKTSVSVVKLGVQVNNIFSRENADNKIVEGDTKISRDY